jgi:hypothetical protein
MKSRARRVGGSPTIAAGSTPSASAMPRWRSLATTTAAGSAHIAPSAAAVQFQASARGMARESVTGAREIAAILSVPLP